VMLGTVLFRLPPGFGQQTVGTPARATLTENAGVIIPR
jgi:hypothetical protein